jgi:hypothetical protein
MLVISKNLTWSSPSPTCTYTWPLMYLLLLHSVVAQDVSFPTRQLRMAKMMPLGTGRNHTTFYDPASFASAVPDLFKNSQAHPNSRRDHMLEEYVQWEIWWYPILESIIFHTYYLRITEFHFLKVPHRIRASKPCLLPVFANKVLLKYSHAYSVAELPSCKKDYMTHKGESIYYLAPYRQSLLPL